MPCYVTLSSVVENNNIEYWVAFQSRKKRKDLNRMNQAMYQNFDLGRHHHLPLKVSERIKIEKLLWMAQKLTLRNLRACLRGTPYTVFMEMTLCPDSRGPRFCGRKCFMITGIRPGVEAKDQEAAKEWREMRVRMARMFTTAAGLGHNFSNKYLTEEMGG